MTDWCNDSKKRGACTSLNAHGDVTGSYLLSSFSQIYFHYPSSCLFSIALLLAAPYCRQQLQGQHKSVNVALKGEQFRKTAIITGGRDDVFLVLLQLLRVLI